MNSRDEIIKKLHEEAIKNGSDTYIDPLTGYQVFTEVFHKNRGYCCNSGCRHCPYKNSVNKSSK
ncbi:DUF5522 domain-containing protein [Bdellovibrio reynosensis]|uniref:DUF5522 domain-containing protein n=1 Tax=Bdellovibrio reynosensis TaxID=2835041 RepID=A0ABY4CCK7_9BACT|nr:DUF5522 domain-containing protein [Bdellovibrio reynosensis]UOF02706.1 DUF5522 domain-containing protein [Bdellovibrio reynosensis]